VRYPPPVSRKPQPDYGDVPKQKTLKGTEIPLPKRREVMDAFRKITKPKPAKG
jgi:hypothetical protein